MDLHHSAGRSQFPLELLERYYSAYCSELVRAEHLQVLSPEERAKLERDFSPISGETLTILFEDHMCRIEQLLFISVAPEDPAGKSSRNPELFKGWYAQEVQGRTSILNTINDLTMRGHVNVEFLRVVALLRHHGQQQMALNRMYLDFQQLELRIADAASLGILSHEEAEHIRRQPFIDVRAAESNRLASIIDQHRASHIRKIFSDTAPESV